MVENEQKSEQRSIDYWGDDVSDLVWKNIKLTTVRRDKPKYHGFKVLERITGNFEKEKRDLVIWGVLESKPLKEIDPVLLALDGFLDVDMAVEDLKQYPGYEDTDENSSVTLIATINKYHILSEILNLNQSSKLTQQRSGESLSNVVRNPDLQHLFKPAIAKWFFIRGKNVEDWLGFYVKNGLLSESKYDEIVTYQEKGKPDYFRRRIFGNPKTSKYLATHHFYSGGYKPAERDYGNLYLPFVLGDLTQINKRKTP